MTCFIQERKCSLTKITYTHRIKSWLWSRYGKNFYIVNIAYPLGSFHYTLGKKPSNVKYLAFSWKWRKVRLRREREKLIQRSNCFCGISNNKKFWYSFWSVIFILLSACSPMPSEVGHIHIRKRKIKAS